MNVDSLIEKSIEFSRIKIIKFFFQIIEAILFWYYSKTFKKRKKNKILRAINKIIFYLQILFDKGNINFYSLEKIEKFNVKSYPMIVASKFDLNN